MNLHIGKRFITNDDLFVEHRSNVGLHRLVTQGDGSTALIQKGSSVLVVAHPSDPMFVLEWDGEKFAVDAEIIKRFSIDFSD